MAVMFLPLWDARGHTLSETGIQDAMFNLTGARPTLEAMKTTAQRIRRAVASPPVTIIKEYGIGWRMECTIRNWRWDT